MTPHASAKERPGKLPPVGDDDEKPLDPAAERVRRRLVRLLIVSFGTMVLGFVAVFGAIVYKLGLLGAPAGTGPSVAEVRLPAGSTVTSAALDGDNILLRISEAARGDGQEGRGEELLVLDAASGEILHRIKLLPGD
ncbi:hypothetical protein NYQ83_12175 [Afifella sp. JA880]|uniref:hypothetical protein n=1 Tax=Afifella sp. JA880 TaxID=2975280 RepID=UPI0021BAAF2C|nr:hypothetical protein [Afifella sp. JA880]MCT8268031.1 hypothetical protein [Afifella sp. JA880]